MIVYLALVVITCRGYEISYLKETKLVGMSALSSVDTV